MPTDYINSKPITPFIDYGNKKKLCLDMLREALTILDNKFYNVVSTDSNTASKLALEKEVVIASRKIQTLALCIYSQLTGRVMVEDKPYAS